VQLRLALAAVQQDAAARQPKVRLEEQTQPDARRSELRLRDELALTARSER
jgi:hypothetical protein